MLYHGAGFQEVPLTEGKLSDLTQSFFVHHHHTGDHIENVPVGLVIVVASGCTGLTEDFLNSTYLSVADEFYKTPVIYLQAGLSGKTSSGLSL